VRLKRSRMLEELARKVQSEARQIEANRLETKRLALRRKAELQELRLARKSRSPDKVRS
jgi:hypothetical protein